MEQSLFLLNEKELTHIVNSIQEWNVTYEKTYHYPGSTSPTNIKTSTARYTGKKMLGNAVLQVEVSRGTDGYQFKMALGDMQVMNKGCAGRDAFDKPSKHVASGYATRIDRQERRLLDALYDIARLKVLNS